MPSRTPRQNTRREPLSHAGIVDLWFKRANLLQPFYAQGVLKNWLTYAPPPLQGPSLSASVWAPAICPILVVRRAVTISARRLVPEGVHRQARGPSGSPHRPCIGVGSTPGVLLVHPASQLSRRSVELTSASAPVASLLVEPFEPTH
jgi:hypothetical protein